MTLKDSNTWLIITLIITTFLGPGVVWKFYQKQQDELKIELEKDKIQLQDKLENLKIEVENEKIRIQKNAQLIQMYEKLNILMDDQRSLYDQYEATCNQRAKTQPESSF